MMNLIYLMNENYTSGYKIEFLDLISLIVVLSGILVIISKNPIISVLYLIGLFFSIACYLMMLGVNYIGLAYLLVYVGAVSILFLFILMLINVRISELLSNTSNSIPLAIITVVAFSYSLNELIPFNITEISNTNNHDYNNSDIMKEISNNILFPQFSFLTDKSKIVFVTSKSWDGNLLEISHINSIGNIMYTSYSMWLVMTSIILLLAMVGAIVITIKK